MNIHGITREQANAILDQWKTGQAPRQSLRTITLCLYITGDIELLEAFIFI